MIRSVLLLSFIVCFMVAVSCTATKKTAAMVFPNPDLQGHRGARGLLPENTIPSMLKAIDLGVNTIELDVVISRDKKVVVSHESYFHPNITTTPEGKTIDKDGAASLLLYQMDYESIRLYDVGMKPHPGFVQQQKIPVYKPLLSALIDSCEAYAKQKGRTIFYNIEVKSDEAHDGIWHPAPPEFVTLVMDIVKAKDIQRRTTIQSFDVRPLQYLHKNYQGVRLSYLVEPKKEPLEKQLQLLGFVPPVYSPYYKSLTKELVAEAHAKGMKVVPWTVNTLEEMNGLMEMGVDGIISDYPNLFAALALQSRK